MGVEPSRWRGFSQQHPGERQRKRGRNAPAPPFLGPLVLSAAPTGQARARGGLGDAVPTLMAAQGSADRSRSKWWPLSAPLTPPGAVLGSLEQSQFKHTARCPHTQTTEIP